ncbi:MAG TPA: glycosyltransferase family A protein, partial [Anaerolineae bacterium]
MVQDSIKEATSPFNSPDPDRCRVSVVIPSYNHARYLRDAIRSVIAQTYRDFEIIIVDDGSSDDTPQVVAGFGNAVRYIRQENRGLAGARNTGVRAARGAFIGLLDADDIWMPEYLASMLLPFKS